MTQKIKGKCKFCGSEYAYYDSGAGFLCENCMKVLPCDEEMQTKVCNSPRMGACAYDGSDKYPDQFVSDVETM